VLVGSFRLLIVFDICDSRALRALFDSYYRAQAVALSVFLFDFLLSMI
jgi:hypothetical protein